MYKKVSVILIILLGIIITIIAINSNLNNNLKKENTNNNKNNTNIVKNDYKKIVIDTDIFGYNEGKWKKYKNKNNEINDIDIYINKFYFGNYNMRYVSTWNLFDENDSYINYEGDIFATDREVDFNFLDFEEFEIDNNNAFEYNLNNFNLDYLSNNQLIITNINNNDITDKIISISNLWIEEEDNYFNYVYLLLDGERIDIINEVIDNSDFYSKPIYNIQYVLNIDDTIYIVFYKEYFSQVETPVYEIYKFENNEIKKVI